MAAVHDTSPRTHPDPLAPNGAVSRHEPALAFLRLARAASERALRKTTDPRARALLDEVLSSLVVLEQHALTT